MSPIEIVVVLAALSLGFLMGRSGRRKDLTQLRSGVYLETKGTHDDNPFDAPPNDAQG